MKSKTLLTLLALCATVSTAHGSGFRIPNQSIGAVGLAGAHVAYTPGPDAGYYNPANMGWLPNRYQVEVSLTTLMLPSVEYTDNRTPLFNGSSTSEIFLLPQLHVVSRDYNDFRFGFSLTYPYGLSKRWDQPFPAASSKEFSLLVIEGNPTLSYTLSEMFSIGGGVRLLYGKGKVVSQANNPPFSQLDPLTSLSRDLDGDTFDVGYNLAVSARPVNNLTLAATFRSKVDLDLDGDAALSAQAGAFPIAAYNGSGKVQVTTPAVFALAACYTIDSLTVEFTWDRTFWSDFRQLDFSYSQSLLGTPFDFFDRPVPKNWDDTDAFRLGITYDWNEKLVTTLGFTIDGTPVPDATLGFELPDSNALVYSAGIRYRMSERINFGISYMYHYTKSRSVMNYDLAGQPNIDGTFTGGGAHAVNVGVVYSF